MKKFALALAIAAVSFSAAGAQAGGFGRHGGNVGASGGLINVSPSIGLGNIGVLNGVLSGNAILSGNNVSGILNGNTTNVLSGILGSVTNVVTQGNRSYKLRRH
ncbi:hypothetical protein ABMA46_10390 [Mesorhizobium sp. CN5-321]|jgi:hypothetical protein|uniref:hypothetical protein n=1 Tax=Mesorhizobium hunchu TaxID=3157708 RepID=UPI0032B7D29D